MDFFEFIERFIDSIDQNFLVLGGLLLLFFTLIYLSLMKWTKNKATSAVMAFSASLLIICFFFSRINVDFRNLSSNSMLNEQIVYSFIPILILLTIIFVFRKVKFRKTLLILGVTLVIISLTPIIYKTFIGCSIGICLIITSILMPRIAR